MSTLTLTSTRKALRSSAEVRNRKERAGKQTCPFCNGRVSASRPLLNPSPEVDARRTTWLTDDAGGPTFEANSEADASTSTCAKRQTVDDYRPRVGALPVELPW